MTKVQSIALTPNGNPYKQTKTATRVLTALGAMPIAINAACFAVETVTKERTASPGMRLMLGAAGIWSTAILRLIGSNLDKNTNAQRMAQADGEVARAEKLNAQA